MNSGYGNSLSAFMRKRYRALLLIVAAFAMIFWFGSLLQSELAPLEDRSYLRMSILSPEGSSFEYTDKFMLKLVDLVNDSIPEKRVMLTVTAPGFSGSGAVNTGFSRLVLNDPDERERSQQEVADYLSAKTKTFSEARVLIIQEQTISAGGNASRGSLPVQFVLQAPNFEKLKASLPVFFEEVNKNPVFQGVDVNLKFNKPELVVSIDREKAGNMGVSVSDIAQTLQLAFTGQRFSYFNFNSKQYQVIGQVDRENRDEPLDLQSIFVRNSRDELIQLDNLVEIEEQSNPPQLYHYNRYMSATVSAGLAPGKTVGDGIEAMEVIADKVLDDSFSTALAGPSRDYAESSSNILFAFLLALLLVYLILAAQFESFIDPLIIMITVPLALAGAIFSLWYFNQTLNIFSQIGMIMLIGLVTKNGILIVEFANQLRDRGFSKLEAIQQAAEARLRPILMTTLATALGALPIALALGAGAESRKSMGIVVIGGLIFSLMLTLYVIPVMYSYLSRRKAPQTEVETKKEILHEVQ
jgi:multidrug efflux pump